MYRFLAILPLIAAVLVCPVVCAEVPSVAVDQEASVATTRSCCGGCRSESETPETPVDDCPDCACQGFLETAGTVVRDLGTVAPAEVLAEAAWSVTGVECSVASRARPPGRLLLSNSHGALTLRIAVASLLL
ncbi:hypothetical protein [Maioricimonas sp. JC845]|uniref:hypothetical protein n=1 Tax=Maioricimonas sp. JC845 TaxID=3232138 RepID=UPI0034579524